MIYQKLFSVKIIDQNHLATHDGSSIVRSSAQNGSSNGSEFYSLSEPDSARSPLKDTDISL